MSAEKHASAKPADRFVLDSFALLAYLENEAGAGEVKRILQSAQRQRAQVSMPIVSLGEALYITEREQSLEAAQTALAAVDQLPISLVDADRSLTLEAAHIKAHQAVSYADAFVVALAQRHDAKIVTGDPEFKRVEDLVTVHWLQR